MDNKTTETKAATDVAGRHERSVMELASAHWRYVESVLRAHGEADDVIAKCEHHYTSAFVHGYKHAAEEAA